MSTAIITHNDLDGVFSAAVYIALKSIDEQFIIVCSPKEVAKCIEHAINKGFKHIAVMDLGLNEAQFEYLKKILERAHDVEIEWFDHHRWKFVESSIDPVTMLKQLGVELHLRSDTCATGVVYDVYRDLDPGNIEGFVNAVCAVDCWRFDNAYAPYLMRWFEMVARRNGYSKEKLTSLIKEIATMMRRGVDVSSFVRDIEPYVIEYVDQELDVLRNDRIEKNLRVFEVEGVKFCVVDSMPGTINLSALATYVASRWQCNVVAVVKGEDAKVSLRSLSAYSKCRLNELAALLSKGMGGGHPQAAGLTLRLSAFERIVVRLIQLFGKRWVSKIVARKFVATVLENIDAVRKSCRELT